MSRLRLAVVVGLMTGLASPALAADLDDGPPPQDAIPAEVLPVPVPEPEPILVPVPVAVPVPILPFFEPPPPLPSPTLFSPDVYYPPILPPPPRARTAARAEAEHYGYGRPRAPIAQLGYYGPPDLD